MIYRIIFSTAGGVTAAASLILFIQNNILAAVHLAGLALYLLVVART